MIERLRLNLEDKESETRKDIFSSYTGARLHGISQIAHKGLVLSVVAAGQLSEALAKTHNNMDH